MTLLAAFAVLLARYSGRDDVVVGSPTAGRRDVDLENLIGFFVNTLVLRTDLSGDPTFRELLDRVRGTTLGAYDHQEVPFEKIIADLHVPRSLSHTPLFQVMFILQNAPRQRLELPGLRLEEIEFDPGTAKFDLTVDMAEVDEGLLCAFEYSTDLFEASTVTRMLDHFRVLLEAVAADPAQRISALPMMRACRAAAPASRRGTTPRPTIRAQSASTSSSTSRPTARRTPSPLIDGERRVTYRELQARANQLAHHLKARGVGPGGLVGVCLERSIEACVSLLAILKAGAAYVPLDPAYPPSRLAYMLADCAAPVLVTMAHLRDRLAAGTATVIDLDADHAAHRPGAAHAARRRCRAAGSGLRHLHVGLDREAEGRAGRSRGLGEPLRLDVAPVAVHAARRLLPEDLAELRGLGVGDLRSAAAGRADRDRSRRGGRRSGPPGRSAGGAPGDPHRAGALRAQASARHRPRPRAPSARPDGSGSPAARRYRSTWRGASPSSCRGRRS